MPNENVKKQKNPAHMFSRKLSLPSDALTGEIRIEMRGRNTLFVCGCRRIIKYSPEEIIFDTKDFCIVVDGSGLVCTTYHYGSVTVEGEICGINLVNGESND